MEDGAECGTPINVYESSRCGGCQALLCGDCTPFCAECGKPMCSSCVRRLPDGREVCSRTCEHTALENAQEEV